MVQARPLAQVQATANLPPQVAAAAQRSQLLADLLQQNTSPHRIDSYGQLAAELGATWINNRSAKKANTDLATAQTADRQTKLGAILASIGGVNPGAGVSQSQPAPQTAPPEQADPFASIIAKGQSEPTPSTAALASALTNTPQNRSNGSAPLGVRQNNPGNIRDAGIPWQGRTGSGGGFVTFDTPENGIRAMARNLKTYGGRGLNTVEGIVNKWAPKSENDTGAYVADVAKRMGTDPRAPLDLNNPTTMQALVSGMIQHENGQMPYSAQQLQAGIAGGLGRGQAPAPAAQPTQQAPQQALQPAQAAPAPQAMAPQAQAPQQAFGQPLGATPQELAFIQQAAASGDPQMYAQAMALGQKIQSRMMEPRKFETMNVNGVPTLVDPYTGQVKVGSVPQEAMNHTMGAQQLGIDAPQGTVFTVDPTGKPQQVYAPPAGYQSAGQGQMQAVRGGPQDPVSGQNLIAGERQLREEYGKKIQDYNEARAGFQKVLSAAKENTSAGDIALVYGFMKTLDPTSTVREGEFATAQNSGSIPQNILSMYNKAVSGERLLPEKRTEFATTAAKQFQVYEQRAQALNQQYGGLAKSYGYDPSRIIQEIAPTQMQQPQAAQQPASPMTKPKLRTYGDGQVRVVR